MPKFTDREGNNLTPYQIRAHMLAEALDRVDDPSKALPLARVWAAFLMGETDPVLISASSCEGEKINIPPEVPAPALGSNTGEVPEGAESEANPAPAAAATPPQSNTDQIPGDDDLIPLAPPPRDKGGRVSWATGAQNMLRLMWDEGWSLDEMAAHFDLKMSTTETRVSQANLDPRRFGGVPRRHKPDVPRETSSITTDFSRKRPPQTQQQKARHREKIAAKSVGVRVTKCPPAYAGEVRGGEALSLPKDHNPEPRDYRKRPPGKKEGAA